MYLKKAITPIVSVTLLFVIVVTSFFLLQNWYLSFSDKTLTSFSNLEIIDLEVLEINSQNLLIKNENTIGIPLQKIKINGQDCNVTTSIQRKGITSLPLTNCTLDVSQGLSNISLFSDQGIFSKKVLNLNSFSNLPFDCSTIPYGDWVLVPGNPTLGTSDFCVMKYEAKATTSSEVNLFNSGSMYCGDGTDGGGGTRCPIDGSVNVTSKASERPLTQVYQTEARQLCANLGPGYSLITDPQWVTIARNAENVSSNWANNIIGSTVASGGGLKRGNVGISDSASYNAASDPADRSLDTNSLAMFTLSNGEEIWDISGNVWEWTNDTFNSNTESALGQSSTTWYEWTEISGYNYLEPFDSSLNDDYGVGRVYPANIDAFPSGTVHAFRRGGMWVLGASSGAFSLYLYYAPLYSDTGVGFRCSYSE